MRHPNTAAATLAGAAVTLALYLGSLAGWSPPAEVSAAMVTVLTAIVLLIPGPKR